MNSRRLHSITSSARASSVAWHVEAERLGGLEVDDQFHLGGLLDRQIGRFLALENTAGICASLSIRIAGRCPRSSSDRQLRRMRVFGRSRAPLWRSASARELFLMCNEENIARYYEPARPAVGTRVSNAVSISRSVLAFRTWSSSPSVRRRRPAAPLDSDFGIGIGRVDESRPMP